MRIRRAEPRDLDRVGALTVDAYRELLGDGDHPYLAVLRDAARRQREAELWVAEDDDGTLLGAVTYCPPGSPWRELAGADEGEFRMLAVAPEARGRGVGEALARHALDRARRAGHRRVVISSQPDMRAAHRIYARLGFTRVPELDWSPLPGVELHGYAVDLEDPR
jgi:ribosomal protein S18 acetylase RimI-like enzyme